jgi:hypothetical protein
VVFKVSGNGARFSFVFVMHFMSKQNNIRRDNVRAHAKSWKGCLLCLALKKTEIFS